MQFSRYLTYRKNSTSFRAGEVIIKVGLVAASFYYVTNQILAEQFVLSEVLSHFKDSTFGVIIGLVFLLMGANWLLETKKWQLLANNYQSISFKDALKAILAGVSMDALMPFGTGAVSSKVLSIKGHEKQQVIAPVIIAQGIQSFWTVAFGIYGIGQLASFTNLQAIYSDFYIYLLLGGGTLVLVLLFVKFTPSILSSIEKTPVPTWIVIAFLSLVRYLIFLSQLYLLSHFLAPKIPSYVVLGCITWMFFAKTIIPKPGHLGAIGIRGASVVFFLNLAGYASSQVVLATIVLWFINLAIPSLVGLVFMKDLDLNFGAKK